MKHTKTEPKTRETKLSVFLDIVSFGGFGVKAR